MDKRAVAADETRRRIVEACFALHGRQGIAGTTMSQIAAEAGVSIGTVYHHFPRYEDAVAACGEFTTTMVPFPGPEILKGCRTPATRLEATAAAVFGFYEQLDFYARVRADRDRYDAIGRFVTREVANRRALVRATLESCDASEETVKLVAAMLDVAVYDELRQAGFTTAEAARSVAATLITGIEKQRTAAPGQHLKSPRSRKGSPHGNQSA